MELLFGTGRAKHFIPLFLRGLRILRISEGLHYFEILGILFMLLQAFPDMMTGFPQKMISWP